MCLAVPGQVQEVYEAHGMRMGKVGFGGIVKEVCLACVPEVGIGEYTLVHAGVAISKIDEQSALDTLKLFAEMGVLKAELEAIEPVPHDERCNAESSLRDEPRGHDEVPH